MPDRAQIQVFPQLLRSDRKGFPAVFRKFNRCAAAEGIQPFSQPAHARLSGIIRDQGPNHFVGDVNLPGADAHRLHGCGKQMLPCDGKLLNGGIAFKLNHFHAVQERFGNGVHRVRRADKQHIRQIIRNIHVMIGKCIVLFRIQHFQQSAGRIAVIRSGKLVHLVQHHNRIGSAALLDPVHNPARHCADVGPAMSADIRLIAHPAETDPHILPLQGMGNASADAGFACARRTDKQKNGAGLFALQIHHGNLFNHAALDLFQAVMIRFQNLPRFLEVNRFGFRFLPIQRGHKIQIVIQHAVFRRLVSFLLQAIENFRRFRTSSLIHAGFFDFHFKFPDIGYLFRVHLVQFTLKILQLFFDGRFLIDILIFLLVSGVCIIRDLGHFQELIDQLFHQFRTPGYAVFLKDCVVLFVACLHPD